MPQVRVVPEKGEPAELEVPPNTLLSQALEEAGFSINLPCGGQGRCGRCKVQVQEGSVRRRSVLRLSRAELDSGWALACQTTVREEDIVVYVPEYVTVLQRRIPSEERRVPRVELPFFCDWRSDPAFRRFFLEIDPPSLADNTSDFERVERTARPFLEDAGPLAVSLPLMRRMGAILRDADWRVTATVEYYDWTTRHAARRPRLIDLTAGDRTRELYGVAIDIGTTSNVVYLVDLIEGKVVDSAAEYNGQIVCGEDVISRIIYARRPGGLQQLQKLVMDTLNGLIAQLAGRNHIAAEDIHRACVAGNTTMIHLFLAMNPEPIRLTPYIPTINHPQPVLASELGLQINPDAKVDCLPGVGSYVGSDITAGVLATRMHCGEELTLFIDVGTNGEMVLGNSDWLISCACSAGPAFEGAGVQSGMRASEGAIEEVWINPENGEPTYNTIGNVPAKGLCGSGIISLLAELFITGLLTKGGRFETQVHTPRIREGEHGLEYVVAWKEETADKAEDIVLTEVDIQNLLRAKAAIYAGFSTLTRSLGIAITDVQHVLIGGAFGKYLNIEKAIQIGLLPDMPHDRFAFLGNTSVQGAYQALLCADLRDEVTEIAGKMTYLELSADNTFTEEFMSAMFLPHTDLNAFPSVANLLMQRA